MSQPKLLANSYYLLVESSDRHVKFTNSMKSAYYTLRILEGNDKDRLKFSFDVEMQGNYSKFSEMDVFIEPIDDIKTKMVINGKLKRITLPDGLDAAMEYMPENISSSYSTLNVEIITFQGLIDSAIYTKLPYIRDAIIVKGDLVGAKIDIKDSVLSKIDINIDDDHPRDYHVRADTKVDHKINIKDSVVQRSDLGGESGKVDIEGSVIVRSDIGGKGEVKESVMVGKGKGKVDDVAKGPVGPNLELYRKALEQAMVDDVIVDSEENMLRVLRGNLGIDLQQHEALLQEIKMARGINLQTYISVLKEVMRDGAIDPDEVAMLETMRQSLGISEEQHRTLFETLMRKREG